MVLELFKGLLFKAVDRLSEPPRPRVDIVHTHDPTSIGWELVEKGDNHLHTFTPLPCDIRSYTKSKDGDTAIVKTVNHHRLHSCECGAIAREWVHEET
jgi:hypothetical protein